MESIKHLLVHCGSLKSDELVLIICDNTTETIANKFKSEALKITKNVILSLIPLASKHGEEPPRKVCDQMLGANLIISLCQFSLAHSQARIDAGNNSARFLSLPLYTDDLLESEAVAVDFKKEYAVVKSVTDAFTDGNEVIVTTKNGTSIKLDISGRVGNCCPGFVEKAGELGSPPDIESNVSPVENGSNGVVVIDGSITCPELGLLTSPVTIDVKNGKIQTFSSDNEDYVKILDGMFGDLTSKRRVLAECGVGLNPKAELTGTMLTDEGALGCMHFGFGSNYTVGGQNKVDFHLDFVFREASLVVDGKQILKDGEVVV